MGYKHHGVSATSLYDRVKKLLVSYEWSDCNFSVSGKKFKAHKLILGISSPVFEAMLYGPLSTNDEITVTDMEPEIFQLLLNYIYTDKVDITSIEDAFELLYASKKYLLEHLSEMCVAYLQTNISIDNVITILNYPEFIQDKQFLLPSIQLFCEHANFLLKEKKRIISLLCMKSILESNQINILEKDIIKHVFEWTAYYCEQNNISIDFESRRDILIKNGLFKLLRFYTLSTEDLNEIIADFNNLLLPCEIEHIKKILIAANDKVVCLKDIGISLNSTFTPMTLNSTLTPMSLGSTLIPRNSLKLQWHLCHRSPMRSLAPIIIDSNNYIIHSRIKANKSVFITSLCVPTRMSPELSFHECPVKMYSEQISVSVVCETDNSVIKFTNFMNTVGYDSVVYIDLSEPCLIKRDQWYRISFIWPLNRYLRYSYLVECRDRFYNDQKVSFEFEDSSLLGVNGGSFLGGLKFCS